MFKVVHREDNLLQDNVAKDFSDLPPWSYPAKYTVPIHKALLKFLDEELVGREFNDMTHIKAVLQGWLEFMIVNTGISEMHIVKEWGEIYINPNQALCVSTGGLGGDFWIGNIVEEEGSSAVQSPDDVQSSSESLPATQTEDGAVKTVFGKDFVFCAEGKPELGMDPYWMTTKGHVVFVLPPSSSRSNWAYWAPTAGAQGFCVLEGDNQEGRAFSLAIGFSEQHSDRAAA